LYASLVRQADARIEWLIVDDGSRDNTGEIIRSWIAEDRLRIRFMAKANGGKHTALNLGIPTIQSRLTMIVDSDDHLSDDAVALIESYDRAYRSHAGICGFAFTRVSPEGRAILPRPLPATEYVESYIDGRVNRGVGGDMAEVFYTDRLQAVPFPEFPGERFIAEDVVWIRMGLTCKMVFIDRPIYVCAYLPGGLTSLGRRNSIGSPHGAMDRAKLLMGEWFHLPVRLKGAALWVAYGRFARKSYVELVRSSGHRWLTILGLVPGAVLHARWRRLLADEPAGGPGSI
jgi:glycosyltransferase involved in cell wall biosynthesis